MLRGQKIMWDVKRFKQLINAMRGNLLNLFKDMMSATNFPVMPDIAGLGADPALVGVDKRKFCRLVLIPNGGICEIGRKLSRVLFQSKRRQYPNIAASSCKGWIALLLSM